MSQTYEVCRHENTKQSGLIYEDGYLVEYDEICTECGKQWVWSYGSLEDIEDENN